KAWWYIPRPDLSFGKGKGSQGAGHYVAENPPFGAVFTYHLAEGYKTAEAVRQESEKKLNKDGEDVPFPGYDALDAEMNEMPVRIWLEVADASGKLIRRVKGETSKGFHRTAWDMSYPPVDVVSKGKDKIGDDSAFPVAPGTYQVRLIKEDANGITVLSDYQSFELVPLRKGGALENPLADQMEPFWRTYEKLMTKRSSFNKKRRTLEDQIKALGVSSAYVRDNSIDVSADYRRLRDDFYDFKNRVEGSPSKNKIGEKTSPTLGDRMWHLYSIIGNSTYGPTGQGMDIMKLIEKEMAELEPALKDLENRAEAMNSNIIGAGGPPVEGF
ncbi:MAG: hypothetical protein AAGC47_13125, partial [Bacteroidota bacterium]